MRSDRPIVPSGCRWCGAARREHGQRWAEEQGWHMYEQPTSAQTLARMQLRTARRVQERMRISAEAAEFAAEVEMAEADRAAHAATPRRPREDPHGLLRR